MKRMLMGVLVLFLVSSATSYAQSPTRSATIWFYRPSAETDTARTVYQVGGITDRLATISAGEFFGLRVAPGVHVFSYTRAPARGESIAVTINAGQQAY